MIDTHCHLYAQEFDADREAMLQRSLAAGVTRFFLPNIDTTSTEALFTLCRQHPDTCYPMMGLHPCSVKTDWKQELNTLRQWLFDSPDLKFYGIGETGLDYYWDRTFVAEQQENFRQHIEWAKELKLPIIIHSRDALDDCIALIAGGKDENLTGIFHCFSGTLQQAQQITDLGFLLGIGGVATFKNGGLDKVLPDLALDHLVLETDAPYLAPTPYRGKRNESSFLPLIARRIAEIKKVSVEEVVETTTGNALRVFHFTL